MSSTNQPPKPNTLTILALLLLCHGASKVNGLTAPDNSIDVPSLLAFKAANDPTGALTWNSSTNHCLWKGINCSLTHPGRVTALELSGNKLSGPISTSLGNLTFLRTLDLSANGLSGELPPLSRLHKLEILNLSSNIMQGNIPDWLTNCSSLRTLDLSRNSMSGEIPQEVGLLSNISVFRLSWNKFTGIIPQSICNITSLETIGLSFNHLVGTIPEGLGKLPNVLNLFLGQNNLSGEIPQDLFNQTFLQQLYIDVNMLTGTLPPNIGYTLPNIEKLYLDGNMIKGQIPPSLGNASSLYIIDLSNNRFTGQVPSSLGNLASLTSLNLEVNNLEARDTHSWEFISTLSNCRFLETLSIYQNQLEGVIPNSIGNLSAGLQELYLGKNNLYGIVPPSVGNLRQLTNLVLNDNSLRGTLGDWVGNLTKLAYLQIGNNKFMGRIPSAIFNLTQLTWLLLSNNGFEGPIPSTLGNLRQLSVLDLSYNNIDGNLPPEIKNLNQLVELYVSSNKLSEEIPDVLGQCQGLLTIQMGQNFFVGDIPESFGNLQNLVMLNLSHNSLSGTIPTTLEGLPSLIMLDLSYNHLQGKLPNSGVFNNATAVSLTGNLRLCGGPTDLHMPSCSPISKRVQRWNYLIKILIPIFGVLSLVLLVYFLFLEKKKKNGDHPSSLLSGEHFLKVSYLDLAQATRDFSDSNLIGRGSYGSVYRGRLKENETEVAVKVFNLDIRGADKSFLLECEALRRIQHRNLLPIITACSTVDNNGEVFKALVYEFMLNGSLDAWIHSHEDGKASKRLGLTQIISIAVNVADALDYIHHDCGRPTVHCDVKPSNILLNDDMNALLGDFGIARFYLDSPVMSEGSTSSMGLRGTIGYIPPEYAGCGHASTSGDVYSFGIVLLEMITGKRPTDPMFKDGIDIVNFVENNFSHQIPRILDVHLIDECKDFDQAQLMVSQNMVYQCLVSLLQIGLSCACPLPSERMDMKQVASKLHVTKNSYLGLKAGK